MHKTRRLRPEFRKFTLNQWCKTQKWISGGPPKKWFEWASEGFHIENYDIRDEDGKYIEISNIGWKQTHDEWDECLMEWLLD